MRIGYDSDRAAAELQLQRRVRQAELALAQADSRSRVQERRVPSITEAIATPPSPNFGSRPTPNSRMEAPRFPGFGHRAPAGSGSPDFGQRVDAIRCRLEALPQTQALEGFEAYEDLKMQLYEIQAQQAQSQAMPAEQISERSEDMKIKELLEAENEELIRRLRQTEKMTQEAAEAQLEVDAQIDEDFRNLEEKMQGELNDVATAGIQLEEHWFQRAEALEEQLAEISASKNQLPKADEGRLEHIAEELQSQLAEMNSTSMSLQNERAQQLAEVQDLQNELREEKQISRRFATEEARAREEYQLQEEQKERFRRAQDQVQTKVQDLQNELREEKQISRRFATEEARAREEYQLQEEQKERFRRAQEQVQMKVQDLQNELREEKQMSRRFATEEARAREEYQLQEEQKERFRRAQEQVQTKVQDLQNELREEKQMSRRFATEEVEVRRKSVARMAEMQSEKQDHLEQIAGLQRLLDDEKQVGKLLASQRMVAAKVQANVTQEMAEVTEQEAAQAEHLQELLRAESAWAEELLDLRCALELKTASLAAREPPRRRGSGELPASTATSMATELAQLESALKRWDARTRALREHHKDVELRLHAQLAHAGTKAMRFKAGQELAEQRVTQLRSELDEAPWKDQLSSAELLEAAAAERATRLEEELEAHRTQEATVEVDMEDVSPSPASSRKVELEDLPSPSDKVVSPPRPPRQNEPGQPGSAGSWRKSWAPSSFALQDLDPHEVKVSRATLTPQSEPRRGWRMSWSGV